VDGCACLSGFDAAGLSAALGRDSRVWFISFSCELQQRTPLSSHTYTLFTPDCFGTMQRVHAAARARSRALAATAPLQLLQPLISAAPRASALPFTRLLHIVPARWSSGSPNGAKRNAAGRRPLVAVSLELQPLSSTQQGSPAVPQQFPSSGVASVPSFSPSFGVAPSQPVSPLVPMPASSSSSSGSAGRSKWFEAFHSRLRTYAIFLALWWVGDRAGKLVREHIAMRKDLRAQARMDPEARREFLRQRKEIATRFLELAAKDEAAAKAAVKAAASAASTGASPGVNVAQPAELTWFDPRSFALFTHEAQDSRKRVLQRSWNALHAVLRQNPKFIDLPGLNSRALATLEAIMCIGMEQRYWRSLNKLAAEHEQRRQK